MQDWGGDFLFLKRGMRKDRRLLWAESGPQQVPGSVGRTWQDLSISSLSALVQCTTCAAVHGGPGHVQHPTTQITYFRLPVPA